MAQTASTTSPFDALDPKLAQILLEEGEQALSTPWTQILASHYRAYVRTGDRAGFEALYFARRLKLNHLVLAECVSRQGRYLDAIIDGLWLIAEESGWQLPAHNAYERGGARKPLPDPAEPVIDLFAAETAANIASVLSLLRAPLSAADETLVRRLESEVERRILQPYLSRHFWWMGRGEERMNNWTAWITQNVLLASFLLPFSQGQRKAVVDKALHSLDAFIKDYAEDGACEEGVVYYRHAALCLFGAMTVLDKASPGLMEPVWQEPKIRNMADFIWRMHVSGDSYFNFADAAAIVPPCGAREFLFGRAVRSPALQAFAAEGWRRSPSPLMQEEWNLWYRLQAIEASAEIAGWADPPPPASDWFYPGIGLAIVRDAQFAVAVKGGNNGESHNHNDVGSLTVYKNGRPLLIDVGVETYTAKTFSPRRYDIWTMQSAYHNVPSFGEVMQADGEAFAARDQQVRFAEEEAEISLDLAGAYPPEAKVERYWRRVRLLRGRALEIRDEHLGKRPAVLSLMTVEEPSIEAGRIRLGELAEILTEGAGAITAETIIISDARLRQSWPERLYRIAVPLSGPTLTLTII
ncbi:heparinase II/III family protein [Rhizobium sp. SSA_523]|uniref:heparinase II/III domain-containing protein n=1 Tax=Rhizobium sp. SSA_523 TaxID=2952477 RepID=UPI0020919490|nr:heparinase II/III family protein [Rhizobium sp. SSA_523]MCO5732338.1 heparinase II/III-family protein [Rhizobium sp. SSA_523]WKC22510.1 heparinase II/III family protein [Rhizobium sp. SSA_523]